MLVTFIATCRSIRLEGHRSSTDHSTTFTINTDPDFHISKNFYPDAIQTSKDNLSALPYFQDLLKQTRTMSFRDMVITYQTESDKWHTIPYPLTAFFRQTAMDPFITNNSANLKISYDKVVADGPKPAPSPNMVSDIDLQILNEFKELSKLHAKRPMHIIMDRLSTLLHTYMQHNINFPTFTTTTTRPTSSQSSSSGYTSRTHKSKYTSSPWNRLERR